MGEFLTSLAQGAAKLESDIRSFVSEHDQGTLGRMARTKWLDETPMDERSEGITNATEPKTGGAMTRRDFLKLAGTIAGGASLRACSKSLN